MFQRAAAELQPQGAPAIVEKDFWVCWTLRRTDLGFADEHDPEEAGISKSESKRRLDKLVAACARTIRDRLWPDLRTDFNGVLGPSGWKLELDRADPQTIIFSYPQAVQLEGVDKYIPPAIRLEMGAR